MESSHRAQNFRIAICTNLAAVANFCNKIAIYKCVNNIQYSDSKRMNSEALPTMPMY